MGDENGARRKVRVGVVISDKMDKTRVVSVKWSQIHPLYRRRVRRRTSFKVHDEQNTTHEGDVVQIIETRPLSKDKRWRIGEILQKGDVVDLKPKEVDRSLLEELEHGPEAAAPVAEVAEKAVAETKAPVEEPVAEAAVVEAVVEAEETVTEVEAPAEKPKRATTAKKATAKATAAKKTTAKATAAKKTTAKAATAKTTVAKKTTAKKATAKKATAEDEKPAKKKTTKKDEEPKE
jgi:small subunit ribosomal protein S17